MTRSTLFQPIFTAVARARVYILIAFGVYAVSILAGIVLVHAGNKASLDYRDKLVGQSNTSDAARQAANQGDNLKAALADFTGNMVVGAVPKTISGFAVVMPLPLVVYQGWVGGIVSVSGDRTSRFNDWRSAVYYLLTLLLQISGYSLAFGAGVNGGMAMLRPAPYYQGQKWFKIFPKEALLDVARIYALVVPLFLLGSLWEFLSPWNL